MMTAVSAKRCPECGKAAMLQALSCPLCGHRYRTRFAEPPASPVEQTESFQLALVPPASVLLPARRGRVSRTFLLAFLSSFLVVGLSGGLLWAVWSLRQVSAATPPPARSAAVQPAVSRRMPSGPGRAERLYSAVDLAMSLYQVDQTAGGTGRVIPDSDPHWLRLSYDFPGRNVCVSLSRTDLDSGDYQVQAVALYRGATLLQRRAQTD